MQFPGPSLPPSVANPPHVTPYTRADRAYEAFGTAAGGLEAVRSGWRDQASWWSRSHLDTAAQSIAVGTKYLADAHASAATRAAVAAALQGAQVLAAQFHDGCKPDASIGVDSHLERWAASLRAAQGLFTPST